MGGKSSKPLSLYHQLTDEQSNAIFNVFRKKKEGFADTDFDMDKGQDIHNNIIRLIIVIFIILLFFSMLLKIRKKKYI
jgi:hypothetical protein